MDSELTNLYNRNQRIKSFCREIKRTLVLRCVDQGLPLGPLDVFINDIKDSMIAHKDEYTLMTLLVLLLDTNFIDASWERYKIRLQ